MKVRSIAVTTSSNARGCPKPPYDHSLSQGSTGSIVSAKRLLAHTCITLACPGFDGPICCGCNTGNAFAIFPKSPAKVVGIVLMVAHQLVAYGLFILPVCIMWEKLWRVHYKANWIKLPVRLPVGGCI
jgi:hypothetical protein